MNADRTSPSETFPALVLDRSGDELHCTFQQLSESDLPPGDVLVEVTHSSVNYKDGLAVTGKGKIARSFPMVPGIDLAGTVLRSESAEYRPGDRVLATGCPALTTITNDAGDIPLVARDVSAGGAPAACGPRRAAPPCS